MSQVPDFRHRALSLWGRFGFRADSWALSCLIAGLALLYVPSYWDLLYGFWAPESQGHEPLVVAVSAWLIWRRRHVLLQLKSATAAWGAPAVFALGLLMYILGRSQQQLRLELLSQVFVVAGIVLYFKGWAGLRVVGFALLFLLFVVPLPYTVVLAITAPLKAGVSAVATEVLAALHYPVGRSGVVITMGQYQLLVAEACAGLQTMFTLEALGLLYVNLMAYKSSVRGALMAILVVPVSFLSNVVRVIILVLVTYYFGDEAGQGFVHGFAGLVLFGVALLFIMAVDRLMGAVLPARWAQ